MPTHERADAQIIPFPTRRPTVKGDSRAMHLHLVATRTGAGTSSRPGADRTVIARRVSGPVTLKERTTMYTVNLGLSHVYAESRRQDMLAEAERARTVAEAQVTTRADRRTAATAVAAMRQRIGTAMVRAGERLQGAHGAEAVPSGDAPSAAGALRIAR